MLYFVYPIGALAAGSLFFEVFRYKICAYLDPGTGALIFQMIIAGFLGGLFAMKLFWSSIKNFFKKLFPIKKQKNGQ